ncbi:MAG: hypothetical protein ABIJ97_18075 [Bacteroidota bacterium]
MENPKDQLSEAELALLLASESAKGILSGNQLLVAAMLTQRCPQSCKPGCALSCYFGCIDATKASGSTIKV